MGHESKPMILTRYDRSTARRERRPSTHDLDKIAQRVARYPFRFIATPAPASGGCGIDA